MYIYIYIYIYVYPHSLVTGSFSTEDIVGNTYSVTSQGEIKNQIRAVAVREHYCVYIYVCIYCSYQGMDKSVELRIPALPDELCARIRAPGSSND